MVVYLFDNNQTDENEHFITSRKSYKADTQMN